MSHVHGYQPWAGSYILLGLRLGIESEVAMATDMAMAVAMATAMAMGHGHGTCPWPWPWLLHFQSIPWPLGLGIIQTFALCVDL